MHASKNFNIFTVFISEIKQFLFKIYLMNDSIEVKYESIQFTGSLIYDTF